MLRLLLDCEVVTPMFLGGAHPNKTAELRVPSFRGALRWWYRALLAGRGVPDLSTLKAKEAAVFGSTDRASAVRLALLDSGVATDKYDEIDKLKKGNSGTSYIWHYVQAGENERVYIKPGERFVLMLQARPNDRRKLEDAAKALWLLSYLGGVGTRSRRMAGSFSVRVVDAPDDVQLPSFAPSGRFAQWLTTELSSMLSASATPLNAEGLAVLHPTTVRVGCTRQGKGWAETVEDVGAHYEEFRDSRSVKSPQKVVMGLPLATGRDGKEQVHVTSNGTHLERRASPVWLQAATDESGAVVGVITAFTGPFAPPALRIRGGGAPDSPAHVAELLFDHYRLDVVL
ncbi:MAG: type III-B CRISPR module RAMP protein Cmr1 [Bacteroidetes bacterium]|jgi:CRISPR-associated protein Cmr1|nr:type III-B CRISPR module RAMP protein Cmr1 [Bacteroidota bacterium]